VTLIDIVHVATPLRLIAITRRSEAASGSTEGIRMLKFSKVGVLLAMVALCGLAASSASAAEWHTNGDRAFASTDAGASRLVIHQASGSPVLVQCETSSGTNGTLRGPTSTAATFAGVATVTPTFGGICRVSGTPGYAVVCSPATLNAISYSGGTTLATAGGGVTTGSLTNIDCRLSAGATQCSTITGSVHGHYINPNPIATGAGRLTVTGTGQSLTVAKIGAGCAAVPHGRGTFGAPDPAGSGVLDTTYTVDGPNAPYIFRTP
jgi:hypothetical protein